MSADITSGFHMAVIRSQTDLCALINMNISKSFGDHKTDSLDQFWTLLSDTDASESSEADPGMCNCCLRLYLVMEVLFITKV